MKKGNVNPTVQSGGGDSTIANVELYCKSNYKSHLTTSKVKKRRVFATSAKLHSRAFNI